MMIHLFLCVSHVKLSWPAEWIPSLQTNFQRPFFGTIDTSIWNTATLSLSQRELLGYSGNTLGTLRLLGRSVSPFPLFNSFRQGQCPFHRYRLPWLLIWAPLLTFWLAILQFLFLPPMNQECHHLAQFRTIKNDGPKDVVSSSSFAAAIGRFKS